MDARLSNPASIVAVETPTSCANSLHRRFAVAATGLPPRPDPSILNEAIPLFYVGQNLDGFWVARAADGQVGGIFLRKQSALNFANRNADPRGCATMYPSERFELDIENKGNPLIAHVATTKRALRRLVMKLPFFIGAAPRRNKRL
jgi:hypothetical protein